MQRCGKILLLATIGVLCGAVSVFCEDSKDLLPEDREPMDYIEHSDGSRSYGYLLAHGDYAKLKLTIRSDKKDYGPDAPIKVMFFLRNDSDSEIHVKGHVSVRPFFHLWKLFHSNYDAVAKTPEGEMLFQSNIKQTPPTGGLGEDVRGFNFFKLKPGREYRFNQIRLNDYFDLTKPDTYELTCFLMTIISRQYYDPPLQSNTLTFRILEEGEKAENAEVGLNPSKGEEVFKQPKPPKSVFYTVDQFTGDKILLDESPTTINFRMVKEREAKATKAPDEAKPSEE